MNKILMDGDILTLNNYTSEIVVKNNSVLYILDNMDDLNLDIQLSEYASLDIYDFNLQSKSSSITVAQENNSQFNYYHTFKIKDEYNLNYRAIINGNNNTNNINIYGVSNGLVNIKVDGIIKENSKDNFLNENIKILTIDGNAHVSPMLHVSAYYVIANHNTAISNVHKDELFYLMSKGIDKKSAYKLIEDGYLYGLFKNTDFINMIK